MKKLCKNFFTILCFLTFPLCTAEKSTKKAVICVPVADLVGEPIKNFGYKNAPSGYTHLPLCGGVLSHKVCPRLHQALFNELVDIVDEREDEVKIALPHVFYSAPLSTAHHNQFWTLTTNVMKIDTANNGHLLAAIPAPLSFASPTQTDQQIITLTHPWRDPQRHTTFSAGTRFVLTTEQPRHEYYQAQALHGKKKKVTLLHIPKNNALLAPQAPQHADTARTLVALLRSWVHDYPGFIPYVWGGCSFIARSNAQPEEIASMTKNQKSSYYALDDFKNAHHAGFDCTGLVVRAAQICGIPYFYKNSTTVAQHLKTCTPHERLCEGDLIWVPGHVMVIADLERNTLIEARHYSQGYGKLHEIPLAQVFKGVNTYQELRAAYDSKQPLLRIDNKGVTRDTFKEWKILKLASAWGNTPRT